MPFTGGRGDATQEWTDVESFVWMEPQADGFRNFLKTRQSVKTEELLLDKASLLGLSAPEMTVLLGGLRVLGANYGDAPEGVFTDRKGQLTNDFFVNLLDNDTFWELIDSASDEEFFGYDRGGEHEKWRATRTDLIFGSNSQLRATAEVYAEKGNEEKFVPRLREGVDEGDERRPLRPEAGKAESSVAERAASSRGAQPPRGSAGERGMRSRRSAAARRRASGTRSRAGSSGARSARSADTRCSDRSGRASTPVPSRIPASIAMPGTNVRPSPLSTICTRVCSDVPIIAAGREARAGCRPTAHGP